MLVVDFFCSVFCFDVEEYCFLYEFGDGCLVCWWSEMLLVGVVRRVYFFVVDGVEIEEVVWFCCGCFFWFEGFGLV